jgi:hypothetical protein
VTRTGWGCREFVDVGRSCGKSKHYSAQDYNKLTTPVTFSSISERKTCHHGKGRFGKSVACLSLVFKHGVAMLLLPNERVEFTLLPSR